MRADSAHSETPTERPLLQRSARVEDMRLTAAKG